MRLHVFLAAGLFLVSVSQAQSESIRTERVVIQGGESGTVLKGSLTGYEVSDYVLAAQAGQTLMVSMETSNLAAYFNLIAPGESDVAFFIGSVEGLSYTGVLSESGDYKVRVYQMRNAARRNEVAPFTLSVSIISGDFADGLAGGPDFWEVTGVTSTLNMRDAPSLNGSVVMQFASGTVLRNNGCRMSEGRRWCRVEQVGADENPGWVVGDYLRESSYVEIETNDALVAGTEFNATGDIPCARYAGQPMEDCKFGVVRDGDGSGMVTIFWPDAGNRVVFFEAGVPTDFDQSEADGSAEMTVKREAGLFMIQIGEQRFEIPEAVILGG